MTGNVSAQCFLHKEEGKVHIHVRGEETTGTHES